jgi:hypothetical protein
VHSNGVTELRPVTQPLKKAYSERERLSYAHANMRLRTRFGMEITIDEWDRLGAIFQSGKVLGAVKNHVGDVEGWVKVNETLVCCYYSTKHMCVKTFYAPPPPLPTDIPSVNGMVVDAKVVKTRSKKDNPMAADERVAALQKKNGNLGRKIEALEMQLKHSRDTPGATSRQLLMDMLDAAEADITLLSSKLLQATGERPVLAFKKMKPAAKPAVDNDESTEKQKREQDVGLGAREQQKAEARFRQDLKWVKGVLKKRVTRTMSRDSICHLIDAVVGMPERLHPGTDEQAGEAFLQKYIDEKRAFRDQVSSFMDGGGI